MDRQRDTTVSGLPATAAPLLWGWPNRLTLLRIGLVPVFLLTFYLGLPAAALGIFVLATMTDWLDGVLARRWAQCSELGAFLDPVADKLLVTAALIAVLSTAPGPVLAIPAVLLIAREVAMGGLREWLARRGQSRLAAVSVWGKLKTALQMAALVLLLAAFALGVPPPVVGGTAPGAGIGWTGTSLGQVGILLLYGAAVASALSFWRYWRQAWPHLAAP